MSKLKRKWLRVIEYEEDGRPLDTTTWNALQETHPDLPILQQPEAKPDPEEEARAKAKSKAKARPQVSQPQDPGMLAHDPQLQHAGPPLYQDPQLHTMPMGMLPQAPG